MSIVDELFIARPAEFLLYRSVGNVVRKYNMRIILTKNIIVIKIPRRVEVGQTATLIEHENQKQLHAVLIPASGVRSGITKILIKGYSNARFIT